MSIHPLAGKPAPEDLLIDVHELEKAYYERTPDVHEPLQRVSFGTSGHRGSPLEISLNEAHILAMTQAICDYRSSQKITGPLFMGKDTHAVSGPAQRTAWKFSLPTKLKLLFSAMMASPQRRRSRERF